MHALRPTRDRVEVSARADPPPEGGQALFRPLVPVLVLACVRNAGARPADGVRITDVEEDDSALPLAGQAMKVRPFPTTRSNRTPRDLHRGLSALDCLVAGDVVKNGSYDHMVVRRLSKN